MYFVLICWLYKFLASHSSSEDANVAGETYFKHRRFLVSVKGFEPLSNLIIDRKVIYCGILSIPALLIIYLSHDSIFIVLLYILGGQGSWRQYLTIPNILKVFNPNLKGYSRGPSLSSHQDSQFNVAETGAISSDITYMAKLLIHRVRSHKEVDFHNDWKIISLMIGPNDFCTHICYAGDVKNIPENHRKDLVRALRLLRDNLPRTLIYLVIAPSKTKQNIMNAQFNRRPFYQTWKRL